MNIYFQYSVCKTLAPIRGDSINEINLLMTIEKFANVYYSGNLFDSQKGNYGLSNYPENIEIRMNKREYDLYYIRANDKCFRNIPKGKPKIWFSVPFNKYCYDNATAIATLNKTLANIIRNNEYLRWIPEGYKCHKNIITLHQTVQDKFKPLQNHPRTKEIRKSLGNKFTIGLFGKIYKFNYPHALLKILPELIKKYNLQFLVASSKYQRNIINSSLVIRRNFNHNEMPYAISACDLIIVSFWHSNWHYAGSVKTLEAAACGVPIILGDSFARRELLGNNYPLFIPNFQDEKSLIKILNQLIPDKRRRLRIGEEIRNKAERFLISNYAKELKKTFENL